MKAIPPYGFRANTLPQPTFYCRPPQAASSITQISSPPFGRTSCTGKEAGASRSSALPSGGRFPSPVAKYRQQRAALIISSVNVMRRLSGLGARCSGHGKTGQAARTQRLGRQQRAAGEQRSGMPVVPPCRAGRNQDGASPVPPERVAAKVPHRPRLIRRDRFRRPSDRFPPPGHAPAAPDWPHRNCSRDDPERQQRSSTQKTRVCAQSTRAAHASVRNSRNNVNGVEPPDRASVKTPRRIRPPHSGRPATRRRMTPRRPHRPGHTFQDEAHPMDYPFCSGASLLSSCCRVGSFTLRGLRNSTGTVSFSRRCTSICGKRFQCWPR